MSTQVFGILAALIEEKTGLHYGVEDAELLRSKVSVRAQERGFDSLLDYYYLLRYDDGDRRELDALIDVLVVPETYFFREFDALKFAVKEFLEPAVARGGRPRVWCAACASGEEPLTVAMLLSEAGVLERVDIVASDMSLRALERAKSGRFGPRALRQIPDPALVDRFLLRNGDRLEVRPELVRAIDFRRLNLIDSEAIARFGRFDLILCRNVLIYFRDAIMARVVRTLGEALAPGGALLVGVSESLLRLGTGLVCEERLGTFFYRATA